MKRLAISALLLGSAAAAQAETKSYLAPEGIWPLCDAGFTMPGCGLPSAPRGVYALHFHTDNPKAVGFRYVMTFLMEDGSIETRGTIAPRADNSAGWTTATLYFGQRVVRSQVATLNIVVDE